MLATWGCTTFPKPTLDLQFAGATSLDSRITFTRGSQATLFDSAGTLVYAKHNLLLQSQDFATTWLNSGSTEQTDVATAPDGTTTADSLTDTLDGVNTTHLVQQTLTFVSGVQYTFSVYAKADTLPGIQLLLPSAAFGADQRANYDCTNGTVSNVAGTATLSIISVGNGWYRCLMTATATAAGSATLQIRLIKNVSGSLTSFYIGDGTGKSLIWGGQLNLANMEGGVTSSLTTYYPTTTAAYYGPRFDYDPSTLAARGLLIEEARTNSIRNNTMQGAVAGTPGTLPTNWSVPTTAGLTTNVIGTGTSNGITYIDLEVTGTTTSTSYILVPEAATQIAALNGQTWTMSAWWSIVNGDLTNVTAAFFDIRELDSGGVQLASGGTSVSLPTSTFTRISATRTNTNVSTAFVQPRFRFTVNNTSAVNFTLRIGLPQLELGAFATSVIPTTTTALTRNADVASMTGTDFSSWFNAVEGTLVGSGASNLAASKTQFFATIDTDTNNFIALARFNSATGGTSRVVDTSATQADMALGTLTTLVPFKLATAYKANDFASSTNGAAAVTDTAGTVPTVNKLSVGNVNGTIQMSGWISRLAYYPARLANSQLQALTA